MIIILLLNFKLIKEEILFWFISISNPYILISHQCCGQSGHFQLFIKGNKHREKALNLALERAPINQYTPLETFL